MPTSLAYNATLCELREHLETAQAVIAARRTATRTALARDDQSAYAQLPARNALYYDTRLLEAIAVLRWWLGGPVPEKDDEKVQESLSKGRMW